MKSVLKKPYIIRNITGLLTLIMMIKIGGYFCIVEEKVINQIFKIFSRVGATIWIFYIYRRLLHHGILQNINYQNIFSPLLYIIYMLLGLASISWSTDPGYSTLQLVMVIESFVFVYYFIKVLTLIRFNFEEYPIDLISLFAYAIFPIMIIFVLGAIFIPDIFWRGMRGGEEFRLGGYLMNPNELGMLSSMGAALSYIILQKKTNKTLPIIMLLCSLSVLGMTSSRSSAIGFLLIIGVLILMSNNLKLKIYMFAGVGLAIPFILKFVIFKEGGGVEEVLSMTGRLPFWTSLLNEGIIREPFLGFGFMRINYTDYFQGLNTYPAKMTHNTFMQVLMNLGFIGFFIAFWQLTITIRTAFKSNNNNDKNLFLTFIIPLIINSFTEFGIFGETNYAILFYQFLSLLFVIQVRTKLTSIEKIKFNIIQKKWNQKVKLS